MSPEMESSPLTPFQLEIARLFFALPSAHGFLLAGGAALLAQRLTTRPTQDLDFFTRHEASVTAVRDELESAASAHGWATTRVRDAATFCRLVIHGPTDVLVDLALDSPPVLPPADSIAGPTFAPAELAARKLLALFDRAEARDFTDVYLLAQRFEQEAMLSEARNIDAGLSAAYLAAQLSTLGRFTDNELPISSSEVPALRAFFSSWRSKLLDDPRT